MRKTNDYMAISPRHALAGILLFGSALFSCAEWSAPESAATVKNPLPKGDSTVMAGRELYMDRCSDCHGNNGKGKGPGASDLDQKPTNFTDAKVHKQTDGELFWKISQGHKPMPGYGKKLNEEQRWQLVHFLRTFAK